jgi:hypothetical protein
MRSPSLSSKHAQDTGATAYVQNGLAPEEMGVVYDSSAVGSCPNAVLKHLLVYTCRREVLE